MAHETQVTMTPDFDLQTFSSMTQVSQETWDRLALGQTFASYRWYRFGEAVLNGMTPFYIVLSQAGEPVARSAFWLSHQEPLPVPPANRVVLNQVLRRWPVLICRAPVVEHPGLILPDRLLQTDALALMARTALEIGREHHASFMMFDYVDPRNDALCWPPEFAVTRIADPGTCLQLEWSDFESYVGQLSKSMRKDYHRHLNRANDLGIKVQAQAEVTRVEEALPLIHNVEREHNAAPKLYTRATLEHAHQVPSIWLTATCGERLVGCGLLLGDGDSYFLALLGLDYTVRFVYFQLFYAAIRAAIEAGGRALYGGSGAYDLKQRLGFEAQQNNYVALASHQWFFRQLGRWLS